MRITFTKIIIITALTLIAATQTTMAQQVTTQDSPPTQGRIVHFPTDRSMGTLYIQDEGIVNIPWAFRKWSDSPEGEQWQIIGPAQGDIIVPPGKRLSLYIPNDKNIWKDLSPLKNLKSNDLYQLSIQGYHTVITNPNDTCMPHIAHLTGLKDLSLKWTNISTKGLQYIKDFHSLEYLDLPTRIDDSTLIFISRFKTLKGLHFFGTGQVTDDGLAALQHLPNLEEISFIHLKKITARSLRHLSKIPTLKHLSFNGPDFSDDGLIYLRDMPSLKTLILWSANITDSGLQFFSNLPQLEELDLYNTNVTDVGIPYLVKLKSLRRLNLRKSPFSSKKTPITEKAAPYLAQIPTLEYLDLESIAVTDYALSELSKLPNLKTLYASYGQWGESITNMGLLHLSKIKSLELLHISTDAVTDNGMAALARLPNLKTLRISCSPKITNQGLANLTASKQLTNLYISPYQSEISISVSGLTCLNKMTNLKALSPYGIIQDGSGLDISELKNLESLDIELKQIWDKRDGKRNVSYESFTDKDLACLANLKNLRHLSLRGSGDITDKGLIYLQGLTNLETLGLTHANLTDEGLSYLKGMKNLNDLRIGGNFTEYGLQHLKQLKSIRTLRLYPEYGIPNRAITELKNSLPNLTSFELKTK